MTLADYVVIVALGLAFYFGRWWERGSVLIDSIKEDQARDGFFERERLP